MTFTLWDFWFASGEFNFRAALLSPPLMRVTGNMGSYFRPGLLSKSQAETLSSIQGAKLLPQAIRASRHATRL